MVSKLLKMNWIYSSLIFWIISFTFAEEPQMALICCDAYKEDHIFSDYVSGFSLWVPEMCWPLQGWLACQALTSLVSTSIFHRHFTQISKSIGLLLFKYVDIHSIFKVTYNQYRKGKRHIDKTSKSIENVPFKGGI